MHYPLKIVFRHCAPSESVRSFISKRASRLDRFAESIEYCLVVIDAPHHNQRTGNLYHVRVELRLSGETILVGNDPGVTTSHENIYVAVRDAFAAALRQVRNMHRKTWHGSHAHNGNSSCKQSDTGL
jgi:ribosome-associated translation inhibitor RaiA